MCDFDERDLVPLVNAIVEEDTRRGQGRSGSPTVSGHTDDADRLLTYFQKCQLKTNLFLADRPDDTVDQHTEGVAGFDASLAVSSWALSRDCRLRPICNCICGCGDGKQPGAGHRGACETATMTARLESVDIPTSWLSVISFAWFMFFHIEDAEAAGNFCGG